MPACFLSQINSGRGWLFIKKGLMIMAFCDNCGMELSDDAKFCENCGAPRMQAASHQQAAQQQPQQYQQSQGYQQSQQYDFGGSQSSQSTQYSYGNQQTQSTASDYTSGSSYSSGSSYGAGGFSTDPVPSPGFVESVQTCFAKYADFNGRARRSEYWYFVLFSMICSVVLGIVGNMIFGAPEDGGSNMLQLIFTLATFIPSLAVSFRRLHDIDKSGTWVLLNLIPCIGQIVLIVFCATDSIPGENRYGKSPKYPG